MGELVVVAIAALVIEGWEKEETNPKPKHTAGAAAKRRFKTQESTSGVSNEGEDSHEIKHVPLQVFDQLGYTFYKAAQACRGVSAATDKEKKQIREAMLRAVR